MFKMIWLLLLFPILAYSFSIESAAELGCSLRYPSKSNFEVTITTTTLFDTYIYDIDFCSDNDLSRFTVYDSEVDRVRAYTSCTLETYYEGDIQLTRSIVEISHINFECGGCTAPQSSRGTTYQFYPGFSQAECTTSNLRNLYANANPTSEYEIADAQWVDCFEVESQNGCYYDLVLKNIPGDNNTDSNNTDNNTTDDTTSDQNTGIEYPDQDTGIDTSIIENALSDIKINTGNTARDMSSVKTSLDILTDDGFSLADFSRAYEYEADVDENMTKFAFDTFISSSGLDFNESNGSKFDVYKPAIEFFHNELYLDLLDDNGTYGIKKLFSDVLSDIAYLGITANPFMLFSEKGSTSNFEPIVLSYQNPSVDWLQFEFTITADDIFLGKMSAFWFMIRVFLLFFAVWYGFIILIRGLNA